MKLLLVISEDWYFCSHRMPIAVEAIKLGWEVHLGCQVANCRDEIESAGIVLHHVPLRRGSINPLFDLGYLWRLVRLYIREKPDVVHHVAMKPCLYGSLAAWICRVPRVVNALAGMGFLFSSSSLAVRLIRWPVLSLFRLLFNRPSSTLILQNPDDIAMFTNQVGVKPDRIRLIRGSGVDLDEFQTADHRLQTQASLTATPGTAADISAPCPPIPTNSHTHKPTPTNPFHTHSRTHALTHSPLSPTFVMVSRLLRDKGVLEFIEAARLLHERGSNSSLVLVGDADNLNPNAVDEATILAAQQKGWLDWLGRRKDIPEIYRAADAAVLPSYYREGIPKSLIEAAASGLAIVTTDAPGCRETVRSKVESRKQKAEMEGETADIQGKTEDRRQMTEDHAQQTGDLKPTKNQERSTKNLLFGANGILIPPRDATALADAIEWLAQNPAERARMGLASRDLAEQEFSIETVVEQTLAIYQESHL